MRLFWKTVIEPVVEILQPEVIVEIGSSAGAIPATSWSIVGGAARSCTSWTRFTMRFVLRLV